MRIMYDLHNLKQKKVYQNMRAEAESGVRFMKKINFTIKICLESEKSKTFEKSFVNFHRLSTAPWLLKRSRNYERKFLILRCRSSNCSSFAPAPSDVQVQVTYLRGYGYTSKLEVTRGQRERQLSLSLLGSTASEDSCEPGRVWSVASTGQRSLGPASLTSEEDWSRAGQERID